MRVHFQRFCIPDQLLISYCRFSIAFSRATHERIPFADRCRLTPFDPEAEPCYLIPLSREGKQSERSHARHRTLQGNDFFFRLREVSRRVRRESQSAEGERVCPTPQIGTQKRAKKTMNNAMSLVTTPPIPSFPIMHCSLSLFCFAPTDH